MKKNRWIQLSTLLLCTGLALPLNGCQDGGSGEKKTTSETITTDANGSATYDNKTYTLVNELGVAVGGVDLTINTTNDLVEIISPDFTYNAVSASSNTPYIFTQKVGPKVKPYEGTLDAECPDFTEDIGVILEQPPAVGKVKSSALLAKPTPKKLTSSNGKAEVVIDKMTLTKDITTALTPYLALNYIPLADQIASQIGSPSATVLAGADVNIADSTGNPTSAADACFTGNITFKAGNELASPQAIADAIASNELALVVFKDKKWQKVNASISFDEGTSTISIFNAPASLRLYPFLFVQAPAANTFTVQGTVKESVYPEPVTPSTIAGAEVSASLPQVLSSLVVDNTSSTVTIGDPSGPSMFQYTWQIFPITNDATDFSVNLLANVSPASGSTSTGTTTFTLDTTVKDLMPTDGQYLLQVSTTADLMSMGFFNEQQTGLIIKNGANFTIQMNPSSSSSLTAVSAANGAYTLPGLVTSYQQAYTLSTSKTGYQGWPQQLYGTITNGILPLDIWLEKSMNDKLTGTYAFVSAGNGMGGAHYWTSYGSMLFDGAGGWTETFNASFNDGSTITGTLPASGSGKENYEVYSLTHLSLWGNDITASASGGINTLGNSGVAVFTGSDQREPVFFTKMSSGYSYASDLMDSNWFFVSYNAPTFYGGHDRITFGSTPGFISPSVNFVPASGAISLATNGTFTLAATDNTGTGLSMPHDCSLNANRDTILCGQTKTASQPVTVAGVKLAAANTYTLASIAGTFHLSGVIETPMSTQTRQGAITTDGAGNWTGQFSTNDSIDGPGSSVAGGTYSYDPASPGRYTLIDTSTTPTTTLYCGVSADMATTVCHIANDPNIIGIFMGVKGASQQVP